MAHRVNDVVHPNAVRQRCGQPHVADPLRRAARVVRDAKERDLLAARIEDRAVDDAVQILGGRGVLADHPVDRLYRSVRSLRIYEGTTEIQHLVIAGQLLK